jgi:hypothetical protein
MSTLFRIGLVLAVLFAPAAGAGDKERAGGVDWWVVEKVCLPTAMKRNSWVVIEYSSTGGDVDGEVKYMVPMSGYVKVPFKVPSMPSKVLLKVGDSPVVDATTSPDVHRLRRQGMQTGTTKGMSPPRDFMVFFYGDERGIVGYWSDHIPK